MALAVCGMFAYAGPAHARGFVPDSAARAATEGRAVRSIVVRSRDIFDPLPEGVLRPAYGLANRLHVHTRPSTVRAALVFRTGDRWSDALRHESERRLRELAFLDPDTLRAEPAGADGDSVDVLVVTRDHWTTSPEFSLESGGGQQFGSFAFTERNFLGLGTSLSVARHHDPVGISHFASLEDHSVFGSRLRGKFVAGTGAGGQTRDVVLELPFWADAAPLSWGGRWTRDVSESHLFDDGVEVAQVPRTQEQLDLVWGVGRRAADGTIHRFVLSFHALDRHLGPSVLEPSAPLAFAGGDEQLNIRRVAGEVRLWRPRFIERRGVEQIDRIEDFDVGPSWTVMVGFSPQGLGATRDEGYVRSSLHLGAEAGRAGFGLFDAVAHTRLHDGPVASFGQVDARWVVTRGSRTALVGAVEGVAGTRQARDFQLTVGGLNGLRAFPVRELSGTQYWRGNLEWRGVARRDVLQFVSVGGAVFWDTARAWGPGSGTERWHHDAGFGLRLSLPHSSLNAVARFDVSWPIVPDLDGRRGPAFSFGSGQAF
ncbi:MAG: hypothetical protein U0704_15595 [Candidatus Eisenbacteria bacterium]